jgi:hypothetical protein
MDLGGAGLSGPLLDFHKSKFLVEIHLNHNNLTGTIPSTLLKNTKTDGRWISINLTSNALNGSIPVNLTRFSNLTIDLTDNLFLSDDLPKEFWIPSSEALSEKTLWSFHESILGVL